MKKFINDPTKVVDESLQGYIDAYPDIVEVLTDARVLIRKSKPAKPKVGIITGGGSGHKPAFLGYVGQGLCDAAAIGEIFAAPPADWIYKGIKNIDMGMGVICLYGNFSGDIMNFRMAKTLAEADGIEVEEVIAKDDIASSLKENIENRRAVAGEVIMWKVGGAAAAEGMNIKEVKELTSRAGAKVGDITMVDTLETFVLKYGESINTMELKNAFCAALSDAEKGMLGTKDLISRIGRSSRLLERSRGHIDVGAASSYIILESFYNSLST